MVDPKVVELGVYNGIPHLLIPVVTDPKKASGALNWAVAEMMDRYEKFAKFNVRDLKGYNEKVARTEDIEDENKPKKLPQIVIIIDELADLMMVAPGRGGGRHLPPGPAGQGGGHPSGDRDPAAVSKRHHRPDQGERAVQNRLLRILRRGFQNDYRHERGGEAAGQGRYAVLPRRLPQASAGAGGFCVRRGSAAGSGFPIPAGDDHRVQRGDCQSDRHRFCGPGAGRGSGRDEYFIQAGRFILEKEKASIGMLQRMFKIGFNRAARIMDQLAEAGVVGEEEGTKPRKILMTREEFEEKFGDGQQS